MKVIAIPTVMLDRLAKIQHLQNQQCMNLPGVVMTLDL